MSRPTGGATLVLLMSCLITSCGEPTPSGPPSGEAAPSLAPTAVGGPTAAPSSQPVWSARPEVIVVDGTWVTPKAGASISSSRTTLAAKPSAGGPGEITFRKVVFRLRPKGGEETVACTARTPDDDGTWSCTADLLALGVPPGDLRLDFDIVAEGTTTAQSPDGVRKVTYAVVPPRPSAARWADIGEQQTGRFEITHSYRVRWSAPRGYATEFVLYDTWECPRDSARRVGQPCFVPGTPVDVSALSVLGRADGDARSMQVQIAFPECGPAYSTVLLRARNAYGNSPFAIVEAAVVPDPRDIIC